jgi:Tol biopolymer transport system component
MRSNSGAQRPKLRYTFEQLANVRRFGGCAVSSDCKQVAVVADLDGQMNLWLVPAAGGFPVQLTFFKDQTVRDVRWSPVSNQIAFQADRQGNELHQLYLLDLDAGARPRVLIDNPRNRYMLSDWSPDGRYLYYTTDDRDPRSLDAARIDVASGARAAAVAQMEGEPSVSVHISWKSAQLCAPVR